MKSLRRRLVTVCAVTIIVGAFGCARPQPTPTVAKSPQTSDAMLVAAVRNRDAAQAKAWLSRGANANARDDGARMAWRKLMAETETEEDPQTGQLKTVTRGKNAPPYVGPTVLMIAAYNCDNATIRALLDAGADIKLRGVEFAAAKAAQRGEWNVDLENHVTPLMEAMMGGDVLTMRLLLQRGASVNATDSEGLTALDWAHNMTPTSLISPSLQKHLNRIFRVLKDAHAKRGEELKQ